MLPPLHIVLKNNMEFTGDLISGCIETCIVSERWNVCVNGEWVRDKEGNIDTFYTKDEAYKAVLQMFFKEVKVTMK